MASLIFTKNLASMKVCLNTAIRTLFAPAALGVDGFKKQQEKVQLENAANLETFKRRVQESIAENKPLFTEDLKTLMYLSRTDDDLKLCVQGLKKFKSQQIGVSEFSFGAPLMRLLYIMNKATEAVKLYADPELSHIFNDQQSLLLLMNKLNEEKRYADTIKLFQDVIANPAKFRSQTEPKKIIVSYDIIKGVTEALYYVNTKEAHENAKKIVKTLVDGGRDLPRYGIVHLILLALNQNDVEYAFELSARLDPNNATTRNIKAVILAHLKRYKEAIDQAALILDAKDTLGRPQYIFPYTLKSLRDLVEKSGDKTQLESLEALSKKAIAANRLSNRDLIDTVFALQLTRMGPKSAQPPGQGFNSGQGFNRPPQRDGGFGFNRPPREGGFGLNRPPRDGQQQGFGGGNRPQGGFGGFNRQQQPGNFQGGARSNQPRTAPPRRQMNDMDDD